MAMIGKTTNAANEEGRAHTPVLRKLRHQLAVASSDPVIAIGLVLAAVFALLILAPVISILVNVAIVQIGDAARTRAPDHPFT